MKQLYWTLSNFVLALRVTEKSFYNEYCCYPVFRYYLPKLWLVIAFVFKWNLSIEIGDSLKLPLAITNCHLRLCIEWDYEISLVRVLKLLFIAWAIQIMKYNNSYRESSKHQWLNHHYQSKRKRGIKETRKAW